VELTLQEMDSKYVSAGKDIRGNMVAPHSNTGRLKIDKTALERRSNYRGEQANHLVKQFCGYRAYDKDSYKREDDLYDAAIYAALVTLGTASKSAGTRSSA
jgi:hypothetical protein